LDPTPPQRIVVELKRGETADLKVCLKNNGTVDDSLDVSARMSATSIQRQLGVTSFTFITQVLDEVEDVTGSLLHPKERPRISQRPSSAGYPRV
jgi:hypothetical protein